MLAANIYPIMVLGMGMFIGFLLALGDRSVSALLTAVCLGILYFKDPAEILQFLSSEWQRPALFAAWLVALVCAYITTRRAVHWLRLSAVIVLGLGLLAAVTYATFLPT